MSETGEWLTSWGGESETVRKLQDLAAELGGNTIILELFGVQAVLGDDVDGCELRVRVKAKVFDCVLMRQRASLSGALRG